MEDQYDNICIYKKCNKNELNSIPCRGALDTIICKAYVICRSLIVCFCIAVGDPLSNGECWDPINRFNPATCVCLFKTRTWISTPYVVLFFFLYPICFSFRLLMFWAYYTFVLWFPLNFG